MTTLQGTGLKANRKCLFICSAVAIASMQYGIDTAAIGGLQAMPGFLMVFGFEDTSNPLGYGIDSTVQQLMTSLMNLGAMVAAILSGVFGAYFGRKLALWLACLVCFAAVALQIGSTSTAGLYVGRLLLGCSNGFFVIFSTVYCSEAAPAHLREIMVGLFSVYVNIGSIIGSIVDNYTKHHMNKSSYRIPLGCMFVVPTLLSIFLFIVPESPRWLLHHERNDEARKSLGTLRSGFTEDVEIEWAEMVRGVAEEKRISRGTSFADMLRGSNLRRTLLCYGTIAAQSASGVWFFIGYQTYFLSLAGITKAFEYTVMNTCIGFLGVFVGLFSLNKLCGRRSVMIAGAVSCGLCQISTGIASSVAPGTKEMGNVLVAFTGLFNFCYNAGVGAASTPIATELVSSRLRAWTVGSANALGYFLAWLVGFCSPYFINPQDLNWGAQYSYIWAASNFICVIWFYFALPETKARSLEELDEIFEAGVAARKFREYKCSIVEEARQDVLGQQQTQTAKQAD